LSTSAERLQILTQNMNALSKWGCGTVFMLSIFLMVWVTGHYIYSSYWVTTVGTEEYIDALELLEDKASKIDEYGEETKVWKAYVDEYVKKQKATERAHAELRDEFEQLKAAYEKNLLAGVEKNK